MERCRGADGREGPGLGSGQERDLPGEGRARSLDALLLLPREHRAGHRLPHAAHRLLEPAGVPVRAALFLGDQQELGRHRRGRSGDGGARGRDRRIPLSPLPHGAWKLHRRVLQRADPGSAERDGGAQRGTARHPREPLRALRPAPPAVLRRQPALPAPVRHQRRYVPQGNQHVRLLDPAGPAAAEQPLHDVPRRDHQDLGQRSRVVRERVLPGSHRSAAARPPEAAAARGRTLDATAR